MSRRPGATTVAADPEPSDAVARTPWAVRPARALPAYLQIEDELAARIESGELPPGARIEPEREIAAALGVSRMTARAALVRLAQRGLIERRQGRGTFVAAPKLRQDATHLRGFFAESVGQGVFPVSELIDRGELIATRQLATTLGIRLGEHVVKIVRLRSVNGQPVVLETSYFPARLVPGLLDLDVGRSSLYRLLDEHYDARPVRAIQALEPIAARPEEAALLGVAPGEPLMLVERTSWDARARAVEHAIDLYRGDRARFVSESRL